MVGKNIFVSGPPGSGKSTLIQQLVEKLSKAVKIGGIYTPEIRQIERLGFKVVDLLSGKEAVFAHVSFKTDKKVGKYFIDVEKFNAIAVPALSTALSSCDLIVIDEIGKMELMSEEFKKLLEKILASEKPLLAALHRSLAEQYKRYGRVYWLGRDKFDEIKAEIEKAVKLLIRELGSS